MINAGDILQIFVGALFVQWFVIVTVNRPMLALNKKWTAFSYTLATTLAFIGCGLIAYAT